MTHARLGSGEDGEIHRAAVSAVAPPESFLFPLTTVRDRLIAGRVLGDPRKHAPAHGQERQTPSRGAFAFPAQGAQGTDELVSEIERTLARMQGRLDEFRTQLDDAFKFPGQTQGGKGRDDGPCLPPAA